ncbi:MAG: hypothetical protein OXP73_02040 [Chloroflexota bacterium]|nr:hypothetical protein [Chloroflexota bacterium]
MARMHVVTPAGAGTVLTDHDNLQEDGSTAVVWVANAAHKYKNTGTELLRIVKGSRGATMTITTHAPDQYGLALPDRTIAINANSDKVYAPLSRGAHNERSGDDKGYTSIAFSNIDGLKVTVIRPNEVAN